jgi:hypothetical protein
MEQRRGTELRLPDSIERVISVRGKIGHRPFCLAALQERAQERRSGEENTLWLIVLVRSIAVLALDLRTPTEY